ncbi:MAG TPA: DUF4127 family protein [Halanaerobiales bacterium]|nr:DUF4127 family protein [Halanaerobiales bacterium]
MSDKIMFIPLDERPCNYKYPELIYKITLDNLIKPPLSILGNKKEPVAVDKLQKWILNNLEGISHLILSVDMLVYGGIIPSRIHQLDEKEIFSRLKFIEKIKDINPDMKIFAYNLITRVPSYNSDDEEPDYYKYHGADIAKYGYYSDLIKQKLAEKKQKEEFEEIKSNIPDKVINDYLNRREKNHALNKKVIDYVENNLIDFLIFPMDDNSEYGFCAKERRKIIEKVYKKELLDKIYSYPGADEVGTVLTARTFLDKNNYRPKVYIKYSSEKGRNIIPYLEDRPLEQTVKYQILAANGIVVDNSQEADYVLVVNTPTKKILNSIKGWQSILNMDDMIDPTRNLNEVVESINYYLSKDLPVAVADVAVVNGSDQYLMQLLKNYNLITKLSAYGAWNTSSNTIGSVVAHANILNYYQKDNSLTDKQKDLSNRYLFLRYLEDWGYQHVVRTEVNNKLDEYGLEYFNLKDKTDFISNLIKDKLYKFRNENLDKFSYDFTIDMPWNRMFEVDIKIEK